MTIRRNLASSRAIVGAAAMLCAAVLAVPAAASAQSPSLERGAVYGMTNGLLGNQVVAYPRAADGTLGARRSFATGGRGSGTIEDSANGLVLGDENGESSPNNLGAPPKFVYATNAGSDTLTVFRVLPDRLERVEVQAVGDHPTSVTVSNGIVYVMNSGGFMCSGTDLLALAPNVTGYRVSPDGQLDPIPGSRRFLSGGVLSGCNQVSFTPDGKTLLVTQQQIDLIDTFAVKADGTLDGPRPRTTTGNGPFGFAFTHGQDPKLVTTENFGALPLLGGVASYDISGDGTLSAVGPTERNGQSDTCWIVITNDDKLAFTTSFGAGASISSYRVGADGDLTLLDARAANLGVAGAADLALSADSRYLYATNSLTGSITAFRIGEGGTLTNLQSVSTGGLLGVIGISAT